MLLLRPAPFVIARRRSRRSNPANLTNGAERRVELHMQAFATLP
jgi:hypothetical protein